MISPCWSVKWCWTQSVTGVWVPRECCGLACCGLLICQQICLFSTCHYCSTSIHSLCILEKVVPTFVNTHYIRSFWNQWWQTESTQHFRDERSAMTITATHLHRSSPCRHQQRSEENGQTCGHKRVANKYVNKSFIQHCCSEGHPHNSLCREGNGIQKQQTIVSSVLVHRDDDA